MPYDKGKRLPGEKASKIGHLSVLKSPLVNELIASFEETKLSDIKLEDLEMHSIENIIKKEIKLEDIYSVDGSYQSTTQNLPPYKTLVFVKTALLKVTKENLENLIDTKAHPLYINEIINKNATFHETVFPLRNVSMNGISVYDSIREVIFKSMLDKSLHGEIFETLKWLFYEKWDQNKQKNIESFECPHCSNQTGDLLYDLEKGSCETCGKEILLTDAIGFHLDMNHEFTSEHIASWYMTIHENLLIFTGIRLLWEENREKLSSSLFIKDGPFTLYRQYGKLVDPIRNFLKYAHLLGHNVHLIGQEKTGMFVDYLDLIHKEIPDGTLLILNDKYIKERIQYRTNTKGIYGADTNYGVKVFLKIDNRNFYVLNIPVTTYSADPKFEDLIGLEKIICTIPHICSRKHENALYPIEEAHKIASLSVYPSAHILKIFSDKK